MSVPFITIKSRDVEQYINEIQQRLKNPGEVMKGVGLELAEITHEAFDEKRSPDGTPWKPLSMVTLHMRGLRKSKGRQFTKGGRLLKSYLNGSSDDRQLYQSGSLLRTVRSESNSHQAVLMVGPHISQVGIHQFGGMAGRNRKVRIPARPFMPIEGEGNSMELMPKAANRILEMIRDYLRRDL